MRSPEDKALAARVKRLRRIAMETLKMDEIGAYWDAQKGQHLLEERIRTLAYLEAYPQARPES